MGSRPGRRLPIVAASQDLEWHERVRRALDFRVKNPDFLLWIVVDAEPEVTLDEEALLQDVETWLGRLDADHVFRQRDEPEHTWNVSALVVRFTAVPKRPEARGIRIPIVGNPLA